MKTLTTFAGFAAGATLLTGAASASATVLVATWTGTVSSGYDSTGVFGAAGTDLTGDAFVARYTYDTSVGNRSTNLPNYDYVKGGSCCGIASPVSATITITGHAATVSGNYDGLVLTEPDYYGYLTEIEHFAEDYSTNSNGYTFGYIYNFAYQYNAPPIQTNLDTPVSLTNLAGYSQYGYVQFYSYDYNTGTTYDASANLGSATLQISNGVPEPTAWALMFAGFGLVGAAIRGRRRAGVAA